MCSSFFMLSFRRFLHQLSDLELDDSSHHSKDAVFSAKEVVRAAEVRFVTEAEKAAAAKHSELLQKR